MPAELAPRSSSSDRRRVFALGAAAGLGGRIAARLGEPLARHEEREFEDGERKVRPLVNVRDRDVYLIDSLYGDPADTVHDKLVRLALFLGAIRDAGAERVTAVVPYLCYARKDARTKPRDPVATRYVASMLEAVGLDRIVTLDVHNIAAFENAFRRRTVHLEARDLFVSHFAGRLGRTEVTVLAPDPGGVKRAERFRASLEARLGRPVAGALMEKHRSGGTVSGEALVGPVEGNAVIVIDDLISTGGTLARAARAAIERGATAVSAAATHGLFTGAATDILDRAGLAEVVVTDSVPPFRLGPGSLGGRLTVLDTAPFLAEAIDRLHRGEALSGEA